MRRKPLAQVAYEARAKARGITTPKPWRLLSEVERAEYRVMVDAVLDAETIGEREDAEKRLREKETP